MIVRERERERETQREGRREHTNTIRIRECVGDVFCHCKEASEFDDDGDHRRHEEAK